ncbi:entry exclusion protein TrbK [Pararhizobium sp. LjRoot255]|uniref:entry exclusion protein TrbK n=1 Tax=Pararhizobium sp. LjRoot255 TaxID=3342298 RepID=UPI003F503DD8
MSRLTIVVLVIGTISLTSAATYRFLARNNTAAEHLRGDQRRERERFFKAPAEKQLVGQEMRPRW